MDEKKLQRLKLIFAYSFLAIFLAFNILLIASIFFEFGDIDSEHKDFYVKISLAEVAVCVITLFYSLWAFLKGKKEGGDEKDRRYPSLNKTDKACDGWKVPIVKKNNYQEITRLKLQGARNHHFDIKTLSKAFEMVKGNPEGIRVLDVGCGDGTVTYNVFGSLNFQGQLIGVDFDSKLIDMANGAITDKHFTFCNADVTSSDFVENMKRFSSARNSEYDIIFSALLLPHISDQPKLIKKLYSLLRPGGVLVLRGSDDGTKICYPDKNKSLNEVIRLTSVLPNISDRFNARKLYNLLSEFDFSTIDSFTDVIDTVGMNTEEKIKLFSKSFSYRLSYADKLMRETNTVLPIRQELEKALEALEEGFSQPGFYYMEMSYSFIARK